MEQLFTSLSHAVEGASFLALGASVVWGILSIILSPCHLASIPLIVGYISGQGRVSTARASAIATLFAVGNRRRKVVNAGPCAPRAVVGVGVSIGPGRSVPRHRRRFTAVGLRHRRNHEPVGGIHLHVEVEQEPGVLREGARAAERLHVSQPSISEQIRELETAFGEKLFRREGRNNKLTAAGRVVFGYAEEIFALGRELMNTVKQRPGAKALRLYVGVVDSFPKLVTNGILKPVFAMPQTAHIICREGKMEDLLAQLAAHRLDIVLADEPASSSTNFKTYNHSLGETGTTFCAEKKLAANLKRSFPQSLNNAPALLPTENTSLRRALETWFREHQIQPRIVAELEDLALMKVMAAEGRGFIPLPSVAVTDAVGHYGFQTIGRTEKCRVQFHAITAERRIAHPAVALITSQARVMMKD